MKWFSILIFIFASQIQASAIPCGIATKVYEKLLERATKNPVSILYSRERMDEITKDCGVSQKDFGKKNSYLDDLKIMGHRIRFGDLKKIVLTADPLNNLDRTFTLMQESAKKGKMTTADFKEIEKLQIIAKQRTQQKHNSDLKTFIDSCSNNPVNLSNLLPPKRDQDSIGWCYAFVAADLVSAKLRKNISPFDIGLGYESEAFKNSYTKPQTTGEAGFISTAIASGYIAGYCEEQNIAPPSEEIINNVGPTLRMFERVYKKSGFSEVTSCELHQSFKKFSKNLKTKDFEDIVKESTFSAALDSLRSRACPIRTKVENEFDIKNVSFPNPNYNSMYVIQDHLLNDRPVGISVDLRNILTQTENEKTYRHAMTIVGQERNEKNECEFIVRNSWGASCGTFDQTKVTCLPDGTLKIHPTTLDSILNGITVIK